MQKITPSELHVILAENPSVPMIDVRTPMEFADVHVPQAQNIPLAELRPESLALKKDQPVYLLCRSGQRATKAAEKLNQSGYAQPIVVEGGTLAWIADNLPVTRGQSKGISLERQVRIAAGALVFTGVMLSYFVDARFIWLSGFVGGGLIFAGITDYCGMGLFLAKMPWNRRKN